MASKTTMRREVKAAGGYYNGSQWVLPGAHHNCAPGAVETEWFDTLEEAFNAAAEHAVAARNIHDFGEREAEYLRA